MTPMCGAGRDRQLAEAERDDSVPKALAELKLTRRQIEALIAGRDAGGAIHVRGSRVGGAKHRMCQRLAGLGLLEPAPPYVLSSAGHAWLAAKGL
ncbi:hypothetical protein LAZ40_03110 [Cereibacter sphaeroides]|uniref:hypothetical protein n=1 Tax=Cereibacter sphaeroides TaxID=1063 RepID=UPI001F2C62BB|nr:hypothetical protein [Cereibacter sphaeroides]MCE6958044.1 hypothetical protein [Cereibacter sphaeroides]MCE6971363.1 hypothetical protein [Cereibacter sphaeroides]